MAKNWGAILSAQGSVWNVPQTETQELSALTTTADTALTEAKNETTRTPVATAQCREAFDNLTDKMRDIKKRYFYAPPLTDADFAALGLKPHDTTPTTSGIPTAQVRLEIYLVGRHELVIKIVYVRGSPTDSANKGYRIWYSVVGHGGVPPTEPRDLRESFFIQRKKDLVQFDYGSSGSTAYFAVQVENSGGKQGPWGPMVSALIP
jgi:hypothetical protein